MRAPKTGNGAFQKVGECLYRYTSNGTYYARIKVGGKEIRRSLDTTDPAVARRNLSRLRDEEAQIDRSKSKLTLKELCSTFIKTIQHQKPKTIERKTLIVTRVKTRWPGGADIQLRKIKPSDAELWIAKLKLGTVSRNLHIACLKDVFTMAVRDGIISRSPAEALKRGKLDKPIRKTPSFEDFKAIVESIRSQKYNGHDADESADFVEFIGLAGLGQAEALGLRVEDINWKRGTITTFRHKTKSGFEIPIYPQVRELLLRLTADKDGSEQVFKIKNAKRAIAAACRRLKLPSYSHRSFRRMFITRAIELGVDVKVVSEWQGHKDGGKLILETYAHVNPAHSKRMAALMTTGQPDNVVSLKKGAA
jgi:integrase